MEEDISRSVTDSGGEVERLQMELSKAQERLQMWKEKTQAGVNELRSRIVQLNEELAQSRILNKQLEEEIQAARRDSTGCGAVAVAVAAAASFPDPVYMLDFMSRWASTSLDVFLTTSLGKSSVTLDVASAAWQELDKYRRRTLQTLRVQTKSIEALELQISDLRGQLSAAVGELNERDRSIQHRDQALNVLQNRLDELEAANTRLESSRACLNGKPNAEQLNAFEERLESEIEFMRNEFAFRENAIFEQHRDEMERLIARHENVVAELRAELEEKALTSSSAAATLGVGVGGGRLHEETNDAAYSELLKDFEALQGELRATQKEKKHLAYELSRIREDVVQRKDNNMGDDNGVVERSEPRTLSEALKRIAELEDSTTRLSRELCEVKKRLIATKHSSANKERDRSHILEGQQLSYLTFVVVKLLCANGDVSVAMNLFPVLSTLLQLSPAHHREIYTANPKWVRNCARCCECWIAMLYLQPLFLSPEEVLSREKVRNEIAREKLSKLRLQRMIEEERQAEEMHRVEEDLRVKREAFATAAKPLLDEFNSISLAQHYYQEISNIAASHLRIVSQLFDRELGEFGYVNKKLISVGLNCEALKLQMKSGLPFHQELSTALKDAESEDLTLIAAPLNRVSNVPTAPVIRATAFDLARAIEETGKGLTREPVRGWLDFLKFRTSFNPTMLERRQVQARQAATRFLGYVERDELPRALSFAEDICADAGREGVANIASLENTFSAFKDVALPTIAADIFLIYTRASLNASRFASVEKMLRE